MTSITFCGTESDEVSRARRTTFKICTGECFEPFDDNSQRRQREDVQQNGGGESVRQCIFCALKTFGFFGSILRRFPTGTE